MADSRFFANAGALSLSEIALATGASARGGDATRTFTDVAPLDRAGPNDVSFLDNVKYAGVFETSKAGACFVREKFAPRAPQGMILLVTENPYHAYALTAARFYPQAKALPGAHPSAAVAASASIGKDVRIEAGAAIGERVVLGNGVCIGANAVLHDGVEIGEGSRIGACSTISHAIVGKRAIIHRGVHIGQDGFGFAAGKMGLAKVPQLGRVVIGDDVEIGSGTCIDRGAGPDTLIGDGTKIDNLVQIGHNVQVGRHCVIVSQVGISGSTVIGDGVMLGGQAGVAGHVTVGAGAKIAAQSGVMHDVPAGASYGGSPAVPVKDWHRQTVALAKLAKQRGDA